MNCLDSKMSWYESFFLNVASRKSLEIQAYSTTKPGTSFEANYKKKFMQGKIKWKKIHACWVDQEKNSCIGLPHILHKSQEGRQESILCAKHQPFE